MRRIVTFKEAPLTLVGRVIRQDDAGPGFKAVSNDLQDITLASFGNKIKVITSFPSADTPVCDLQIKEFNKRATGFSADVVVIGVSKDLPFAQARFCQLNGIKNVTTLSDYKYSSFGINYGLLVKELNLLARAALILDGANVVRYIQVVSEITQPPDYEAVLVALETIVKNPQAGTVTESGHCKPCEGGVLALSKNMIERFLAGNPGWELVDDTKLVREFKFKDFAEAKYFLDLVAIIAEEQGHHPTLTLMYNKLRVILTTHMAGGVTDNDFVMARIIDEIRGE
ncbi:MAG: thiol peroxidase [Candidatus Omnitrophota bacterium]|nr:thiol peroxidase [Candidatus Omnitrophota bacterium]